MKAKVDFIRSWSGYTAIINIEHPFLAKGFNFVRSIESKSKGELKRKAIQFCSDLNFWFWPGQT